MGACVKAERNKPETAELEQWLRAICDEGEPSVGVQARLAADSHAAVEFQEARDLVSDLRAALQPEPMPEPLVARIRRRIGNQSAGSPRIVRIILPLVTAAAAALALAVVSRFDGAPRSQEESLSVALSSEDAADIIAANALLSWEGQLQTAVSEIAADVGDLQKATEQISQAGQGLPWSAEDDWDAATTEGQSRAGADSRA